MLADDAGEAWTRAGPRRAGQPFGPPGLPLHILSITLVIPPLSQSIALRNVGMGYRGARLQTLSVAHALWKAAAMRRSNVVPATEPRAQPIATVHRAAPPSSPLLPSMYARLTDL